MQTATSLAAPLIARSIPSDQIRFYREEGYVVLPRLLQEGVAQRLRSEVLEIMKKIGLPSTALRQTPQYLAGGALEALVNSPHLRSLAAQLMEGPSSLYIPFTAVKSPGGGTFHFHQDNMYTRFDGPGINFWFALNPMSPQNGCLQVVPRSHKSGTYAAEEYGEGTATHSAYRRIKWKPEQFVPLTMEAGDCVAFSRLTVHGSGANESNEPRVAYAINFHRDDVKALREDGQWKSLKQFPAWPNGPVKEITVPVAKKTDGH